MADKARQKALADVRSAQAKLAGAQDKLEDARKERRESFERARKALWHGSATAQLESLRSRGDPCLGAAGRRL